MTPFRADIWRTEHSQTWGAWSVSLLAWKIISKRFPLQQCDRKEWWQLGISVYVVYAFWLPVCTCWYCFEIGCIVCCRQNWREDKMYWEALLHLPVLYLLCKKQFCCQMANHNNRKRPWQFFRLVTTFCACACSELSNRTELKILRLTSAGRTWERQWLSCGKRLEISWSKISALRKRLFSEGISIVSALFL